LFLTFTWHTNIHKIHEDFLSLDAMTVVVWFNLAGSTHGGASTTLILALCFVVGMVVTDSINGLLVAKLITRSEQFVRRAGRLFSILVAGSALAVAGFDAAKLSSELVSKWADGRELMTGVLVLGMILVGYLLARRLNRTTLSVMDAGCHPSM
jgi:high-affinity nickel-transport protein